MHTLTLMMTVTTTMKASSILSVMVTMTTTKATVSMVVASLPVNHRRAGTVVWALLCQTDIVALHDFSKSV